MISYDRSSTVSPLVLALGALLIAGGVGAWWWMSGNDQPETTSAAEPATAASAAPTPSVADAALALGQGDADFAPENLASLNQAMGAQPNGQQELQRVTTFLKFQRGFERWQEMMEDADPSVRHALANSLMAALPERVKGAEITLPEGTLMCAMLLNDLEPDEAARERRLAECNKGMEAVAPRVDTEQGMREAQCQTEYRRREAALVAEFQARPAAQRDPARLEADLDKTRKDVYDSPTCGQ